MPRSLVFGLGVMAGWSASALYLIPEHKREADQLSRDLSAEKVRSSNAEIDARIGEVRVADRETTARKLLAELDAARRMLARESITAPSVFADPDVEPADRIPAAGVVVPRRGEWSPPK